MYLLDGNGTFDTTLDGSGFPSQRNFGNAFLKLSTTGGLAVADYFATFDTVQKSNADSDLGSGGVLVLPDLIDNGGQVRHLAVGAGKDRHIYVVNRDSMGKWNASSNQIYQDISGALNGSVFSKPVYFNNTVYYAARVMRSRHSPSPTHASRRRPRRPARGRSPIPIHTGRFVFWTEQWHRLGGRKHEPRGSSRLRCRQPGARAL